jgi:phosphonate transport system substrate-binding protein
VANLGPPALPGRGLAAGLLLLAALVAVPGCQRAAPTAGGRAGAGATSADSASAPGLLIGLIPEQNIFRQVERYEPIAEYLTRKLGARVHLTVLPRYGNVVDNFVTKHMDGAFFGSFTYALTHRKIGVDAVARPLGLDGRSTYHGLILVRQDSAIRAIEDLRGKRFAFVDQATTAGFLFPLMWFKQQRADYRKLLRESYFAGTHEAAITDVLDGKADIGAAKNTVFDRLAAADPRLRAELLVLARSPDVPENALAVRKDLDPAVRARLKTALVDMHEEPAGRAILEGFGAQRFIATTDADYEPLYELARQAGLELATYDYRND